MQTPRSPLPLLWTPNLKQLLPLCIPSSWIFAQLWAPFSSLLTEMGSDRLNKRKSLCQGNRYSFSHLLSPFLSLGYSVLGICTLWAHGHTEAPTDPCPTNLIRRETFIPCYSCQELSAAVIEGLGITLTSADWSGKKGQGELGARYGGEGHPVDRMGNYKRWRW